MFSRLSSLKINNTYINCVFLWGLVMRWDKRTEMSNISDDMKWILRLFVNLLADWSISGDVQHMQIISSHYSLRSSSTDEPLISRLKQVEDSLPLTLTRPVIKRSHFQVIYCSSHFHLRCVVGLRLQQEEHSKDGDVNERMNYSVGHHRIRSDWGDTAVRL